MITYKYLMLHLNGTRSVVIFVVEGRSVHDAFEVIFFLLFVTGSLCPEYIKIYIK